MIPEAGSGVAVALSGGLDSAAAAVLLKRQGLAVTGVTMLLPSRTDAGSAAIESARAIAGKIGIGHQVIDLRSDFESMVVEPFVEGYLSGLTPNPCVECNRRIKFGLLLDKVAETGSDFLATGHYARVRRDTGGRYRLLRAADAGKDQSYVLWALDRASLERVLFPLGDLTRGEVEGIAGRAGLAELARPESQDICFMGGYSYRDLIKSRAPAACRPGPVLDPAGNILGEHRGLAFFTVGQRRGLGLGTDRAMYVLELRPEDNAVVVGEKELLACSGFPVHGLNFVAEEQPRGVIRCDVKTRYKGPALACELKIQGGGSGIVSYPEDGPPAAPGQSAVFYIGDELLGGGFITGNR